MPYTKPGTVSAPTTLTTIATQGARPTRVPNQKGSIVVLSRPGGFISSWIHPKRIIPTLAPALATIVVIPVRPE
jgi:hypothetical protein